MAVSGQLLLDHLWTAGLSFMALALIFRPLEWAFPAKQHQKFFRAEWLTDLAFFLGQYLLWGGLIIHGLSILHAHCDSLPPQTFRNAIQSLPWLLQAVLAVLLGDFCIYWVHRLQHRSDLLWRFHSVHHTAEHLDWLAAHREHPVDGLITQAIINLPAFLLGFPIGTLSWLVLFRGLWAIYIHSNVRLSLGPLRMLIGSPELHHWHHAREKESCNFANLSPLMDVLFGTYRCPSHEPESLGISEPFPRSYHQQLLHSFRRAGR